MPKSDLLENKIYFQSSKLTAPQDAHKRLVLHDDSELRNGLQTVQFIDLQETSLLGNKETLVWAGYLGSNTLEFGDICE